MGLASALGAIGTATEAGVSSFNNMEDTIGKYRKMKQESGDRKAVSDAMDKAKADRQADIDSGKANVGDLESYYQNEAIPAIKNHFIQNGELGKAQAWENWNKNEKTQKHIKQYARVYTDYLNGNEKGALKGLQALYNDPDYMPDGYKAKKITINKDKDGKQTGYTVDWQDQDGKIHQQKYTGSDIIDNAILASDPTKAFALQEQRRAQADKTQGKLMEAQARTKGQFALEDYKQKNRVQSENLRASNDLKIKLATGKNSSANMKNKFNAFSNVMKNLGYSDKTIKGFAPVILGVESKHMSREDRLLRLVAMQNKNSTGADAWSKLSDTEKLESARKTLDAADAAAGNDDGDNGGSSSSPDTVNTNGNGVLFSDGNGNTFKVQ